MNSVANFVASLIVDCHVVLFATVLLDLRHDFLFTVAAHLPITVLRSHIGTFKVDFTLALRWVLINFGIHGGLLTNMFRRKYVPPIPDPRQYPDHPIVTLCNKRHSIPEGPRTTGRETLMVGKN
jgi:hypothetical protein